MASMERQLAQQEAAEDRGLETDVTGSLAQKVEEIDLSKNTVPIRKKNKTNGQRQAAKDEKTGRQKLGQCERCGYMSSQTVCKACVLLEGLNKSRPKTGIEVVAAPG